MNRAKRLLSIYVAIFIAAILIAVPVAVYLLPPRAVPIEVQNGFAEYNWTSDHFYNWSFLNGTNGTDVEFTNTVAIAIVHDPSNDTSTMNFSLTKASYVYGLPYDGPNSSAFDIYGAVAGNITPNLEPTNLSFQLNTSLPTVLNNSEIPQISNVIFWPVGPLTNLSWAHSTEPINLTYFDFLNRSKNSNENYRFSTAIIVDVALNFLKYNTTYPLKIIVTINGLQEPVYSEIQLNIRGTD